MNSSKWNYLGTDTCKPDTAHGDMSLTRILEPFLRQKNMWGIACKRTPLHFEKGRFEVFSASLKVTRSKSPKCHSYDQRENGTILENWKRG